MRPRSIVQYEQIYIASIVVGLLSLAVVWPVLTSQFAATSLPSGLIGGIALGAALFGIAINLLLLWLTARKANEVARIIVAIFFVIGILSGLRTALTGNAPGLIGVTTIVQIVLEGVMLYLLFVPADAKAWFASRRPPL